MRLRSEVMNIFILRVVMLFYFEVYRVRLLNLYLRGRLKLFRLPSVLVILFDLIDFIEEVLFHFFIIKLLVDILQASIVLHGHEFIGRAASVPDHDSGLRVLAKAYEVR